MTLNNDGNSIDNGSDFKARAKKKRKKKRKIDQAFEIYQTKV